MRYMKIRLCVCLSLGITLIQVFNVFIRSGQQINIVELSPGYVKHYKHIHDWPFLKNIPPSASGTSQLTTCYESVNDLKSLKVGDTLRIKLFAKNTHKKPKTYGGDLFSARIHSATNRYSSYADVIDHYDGQYTIEFYLPVHGEYFLDIRLVHNIEAISYLEDLHTSRYNERQLMLGDQELPPGQQPSKLCYFDYEKFDENYCNLTNCNAGEPWICRKREGDTCEKLWHDFNMELPSNFTTFRDHLYQIGPISSCNPDFKVITNGAQTPDENKVLEIEKEHGYFMNGTWLTLRNQHIPPLDDETIVMKLRGRRIHFFGDSNARVNSDKFFNIYNDISKRVKLGDGESPALHHSYQDHGHAFSWRLMRCSDVVTAGDYLMSRPYPTDAVYISHLVHIMWMGEHILRRQLLEIKEAISIYQKMSPGGLILLRSPHYLEKNEPVYVLRYNNWYAYKIYQLFKEIFYDMNAVTFDVFQMVIADGQIYATHPEGQVRQNEMDMLFRALTEHFE